MRKSCPTRAVLHVATGCLLSALCAINWLGVAAVLDHACAYYGHGRRTLDLISNLYLGLYCLTCMPCGYVVDMRGVRFASVLGAASQAAGAALCATSSSIWALVAGSSVAAAGQPLIVSTAAAFARDYAPEWTGRATTVMSVSNNLGSAVAYLVAPRLTRMVGVRGWLECRALFALFCFFIALRLPRTEPRGEHAAYSRRAAAALASAPVALLVSAYAIGQGAFWAWAELLDAALLPVASEKVIGDLGALVTVVASLLAVVAATRLDASKGRLEVALAAAQTLAALAAFALAATVANRSLPYVALAWLAFSTASTPIMPLGAELAAARAPPDLVGATLAALFVGAELTSAAFGFALAGLGLVGSTLVAAIAAATALAALLAAALPCFPQQTSPRLELLLPPDVGAFLGERRSESPGAAYA